MEPLIKSTRIREYKAYPSYVRGQIAFTFLHEKTIGHRELDEIYLGKDPINTKGFLSMGVLHFQGIKKNHHGVLAHLDLDEIICEVKKLENSNDLITDLEAFKNNHIIDRKTLDQEFLQRVETSLNDDASVRKSRLKSYNIKPKRIQITSYSFDRNPDVVAEALIRANGYCEKCNQLAPFLRKTNNSAYLEVHHIKTLSENGNDELKNVLALCPNCHREIHHGFV